MNEPQFGKSSPMRNPLKSDTSSTLANAAPRPPANRTRVSPFNHPKPGHARPEHHRTFKPPLTSAGPVDAANRASSDSPPQGPFQPQISSKGPAYPTNRPSGYSPPQGSFQPHLASKGPSYPIIRPTGNTPPHTSTSTHATSKPHFTTGNSPDFFEIPRPTNFTQPPRPRAQQPLFQTSAPGSISVNAWKQASRPIDLTTKDDEDGFNPDKALGIDRYGGFDPTNYVESAQANENIKALLEGAFDDEDDKPKTRLRQRKKDDSNAAALTNKLATLKVDEKTEAAQQESEAEEDDGTVEGLSVKLLPHQIDGVAWMLDKEVGTRKKNGVLPKGGILADDMGLGKTIQALSLILTNRRPSADDLMEDPKLKVPEAAGKSTLIVGPLALIKQWEGEIKDKVDVFPKLKVLVHHGPSRTKRFEDLKEYDIVITTYQTLTSEHGDSSDTLKAGCFGVYWYRIILDEAHSIKNRNAKMTKAAYDLRSVYRWCLTGTPMQNNLDELQSLIRFLNIKPYCQLASWREQIAQPMKNGRGGLAMKRLQFFLRAFMKRRTKEVLKKEGALNFGKISNGAADSKTEGFKIVARNVKTIVAEFDDAEREFYLNLEARTEKNLAAMMGGSSNDYIGALVLLLRLRQTCNHPELIKGNLRKDKDAMASSSQPVIPATPRKSKSSGADDLDDMADMFGAMSVKVKKCDGCGTKLDEEEVSSGAIRCNECDNDFRKLQHRSKPSKFSNHKKSSEGSHPADQQRRRLHTRRIIESDDEGEGDSLVSIDHKAERRGLGKAGGADDEDAERGGRWLGDDDSDTDEDEDSSADRGRYASGEEPEIDEDEDQDEDEDDDDGSSDDSHGHGKVDQRHIPSTKIRRLMQILEEESDQHKFIVFSEFTSMLDLVEPFLRNAGFRFTRYDGSMKNDDREASLERLRNDKKVRILLCSLRCGSLGLNLTAASRVVIMEPFWNPVCCDLCYMCEQKLTLHSSSKSRPSIASIV